LNNLIPFKN